MVSDNEDELNDPDKTVRMDSTAPAEDVEVGTVPNQLGPYHIEGELGRGGMGVVYVGLDARLDRRVAIKMLPERVARDPQALTDLENEAKLLASLNHPNIATIYSLENIDGFRFFTLELITGDTLAKLIPQKKLSVAKVLHLFRQIAQGLGAAHESGVIHCDLKPANVLVAARETPKILDFGIARAMGRGPKATGKYRSAGTPGYMSPEQIAGRNPDERSDIWAFGCVLYESLTGQRAFSGNTTKEVWTATIREKVDPDALPPNLPGSVRDIVLRCLEKDPGRRLADISDAVGVLDGAAMSFRWQEADDALAETVNCTLKEGDKAAPFELVSSAGERVRLQDMLSQGPLVLSFYRGRWCPVCTQELVSFQERLGDIASRGGNLVAISPQMPQHNKGIQEERGLAYQLLSDPGNQVAKAYGVAFALPNDLRNFHRNLGLDLKEFNGDDSWILPLPATFVIDRGGTIRYSATSPDPTTRPDPRRAVQVLAAIGG